MNEAHLRLPYFGGLRDFEGLLLCFPEIFFVQCPAFRYKSFLECVQSVVSDFRMSCSLKDVDY